MAVETVGNYQLHLFAYELPSGRWDPFLTILKFDFDSQMFLCVTQRRRASDNSFDTYDEAIDEARRVGTALVETGTVGTG